jgi:hypothetical protein
MRKLFVLAAVLFSTTIFAQNEVQFNKTEHNFGKIKQHVPATYTFTYTNTTTKPLVVEVATAECGCTTPEYNKQPTPKGKTSTIKVTYNSENPGSFSKKVTVKFANIAAPLILTIKGEVTPAAKTK